MPKVGVLAACGFIATVFVANWLVDTYGTVDVGFGLQAPAAVFAVGVAFTLRDIVQRTLGPWVVIGAIVIGAALSTIVSPTFALASGTAFLVSEILDLLVYTPLEKKNFFAAVAASNTVGIAVDSLIFLAIAFGNLDFFWGQVVGKSWMTLAALALLVPVRKLVPARV